MKHLLTFVLLYFPALGWSCICNAPPIEAAFKSNKFVLLVKFDDIRVDRPRPVGNYFLGSVEELEESEDKPDSWGTKIFARYQVIESFKEDRNLPAEIVLTEGMCSVANISLDHYYLIFTNDGRTNVYCGRSRPVSPWTPEHVKEINQLRRLRDDA